MQRRKLVNLLSLTPIVAALCVAAYKFGPSPARTTKPAPAEPAASAASATVQPEHSDNTQLFDLLGMQQTAVGKGRVAVTPAEYLDSLETVYRQRGYRKLEPLQPEVRQEGRRGRKTKEVEAIKFFQRSDEGGMAGILATGDDADFNSNDVAPEPYTFSTLVVPVAGGGSEWASYRLTIDPGKSAQLARLEDDDFPGFDPVNVPRLPGLQRIYVHSSGSASIAIYKSKEMSDVALLALYVRQMPQYGWSVDERATAAANNVVSGVICFTQGARSCLIWVTPGKDKALANVTISSH